MEGSLTRSRGWGDKRRSEVELVSVDSVACLGERWVAWCAIHGGKSLKQQKCVVFPVLQEICTNSCSPLITRIGQRVHRADLHHSTPVHSILLHCTNSIIYQWQWHWTQNWITGTAFFIDPNCINRVSLLLIEFISRTNQLLFIRTW